MSREYPDLVAGPYEPPPVSVTDEEGRSIVIDRLDDDLDALVEMYERFDPADRAQGIPPTDTGSIRQWLADVTGPAGVSVVARLDDVVGHALLVADGRGACELAIFVLGEYQGAGIGTALIEALLGEGREEGIERVWLTVERWNAPARALYRKVGFEAIDNEGYELEMTARLQ